MPINSATARAEVSCLRLPQSPARDFLRRIAGIRDGVGFHADTVEGLREAFREAVEDDLETCARIGTEPQRAFFGQMMFRENPEVHRRAVLAAELAGKSLNQWAEEVLGKAAGEELRNRLAR